MAQVERIAELCHDLITCTEDTSAHKAWCLSIKGAQQIELLHGRINPAPLFKLQDELPRIEDMSSYHCVSFLEDKCSFIWFSMPRKPLDRIAI